MRYIFICFLLFFLVHAAWERFCLFLAVIDRQQVTTRNPPSLLSTGDYQVRTRKTVQATRSLSSIMVSCFMFGLHGKILVQCEGRRGGGHWTRGTLLVKRCMYRGSPGGPNTTSISTAALEHDWRAPGIPCWASAEAEYLHEHTWR